MCVEPVRGKRPGLMYRRFPVLRSACGVCCFYPRLELTLRTTWNCSQLRKYSLAELSMVVPHPWSQHSWSRGRLISVSVRPAGEILILIDFIDLNKTTTATTTTKDTRWDWEYSWATDHCLAQSQAQSQAQSPAQETDEVGKMEAQLRALPVLFEDPGLAPRIMWCTTATTQGIRHPAASEGTRMHMAYTKSQGRRYIQINKKSS